MIKDTLNYEFLKKLLMMIGFLLVSNAFGQIRKKTVTCDKPKIVVQKAYGPKIYGNFLMFQDYQSPTSHKPLTVIDLNQNQRLPQVYPPPSTSTYYYKPEPFPFGVVMRKDDFASATIVAYTFSAQGWTETTLAVDDRSNEYLLGPTVYVSEYPSDDPLGTMNPYHYRKTYLGYVKPSRLPNNGETLFASEYDFSYCLMDAGPYAATGCFRGEKETFRITDPVAQNYFLFGEPKVTMSAYGSVGFLWTGVQYSPYPFISAKKHFRTEIYSNGQQGTTAIYDHYNESGKLLDHVHGLVTMRTENFFPGVALGFLDPGQGLLPIAYLGTNINGASVRNIKLTRFFDSSPVFNSSQLMVAYSISNGGRHGFWNRGIYVSRVQNNLFQAGPATATYIEVPDSDLTDPFLVSTMGRSSTGKGVRGTRLYFTAWRSLTTRYPDIMSTFCY